MKKTLHVPALGIGFVILAFFFTLSLYTLSAQETAEEPQAAQVTPPEPSPLPQYGPRDPAELEAFVDGIMAAQLDDNHVVGATFSFVKDGQLFLAKGYGFADIKNRKPVLAGRTLFRPGSVSKLFIWTAVMQLVEQGKLSLHTDVNNYLKDFKIPEKYPKPITLFNLLTHTPGFEDQALGLLVRTPAELQPLGEFLATHIPARVRPPGELSAYSNYGTALAGYLVELASGMPYEQYIEEYIFKPLDMQHSSFRQPLPAELAEDMSLGYKYQDGEYKVEDFEYIQGAPAGALSAAALDMAKFMVAHLQKGRYGEIRILQESTAEEMHAHQFAHSPKVSGWAYGFFELLTNGQRIIWHGGDTLLFHSALVLLPEHNLGFFLSYNSVGGAGLVIDFIKGFMDRYFPVSKPPSPEPSQDFKKRASHFAGSYLASRNNWRTLEKIAGLFTMLTVSPTDTGTLKVSGAITGKPTLWVEVEPLVFKNIETEKTLMDTIVFGEDTKGRIKRLYISANPTVAYLKLPWYATPSFQFFVSGFSLLLFLSVLAWPFAFLACFKRWKPQPILARAARWVSGVAALLALFFSAALIVIVSNPDIIYGITSGAKKVFLIPWILIGLTLVAVGFTVLVWMKRYWGLIRRIHYSLVTLALLLFIWILTYWNLVTTRF